MFFAATGVSDGDLLRGVRYVSGGASTNSIVMRASSGTGAPHVAGHTCLTLPATFPTLVPRGSCSPVDVMTCGRLAAWQLQAFVELHSLEALHPS